MTIAVGFLCDGGQNLVIAVDRQFTAPGTFKYHAKKYIADQQGHLGISFAFAGDPGMFEEFQQKVMGFLDTQEVLSADLFRQTIDAVVSDMGLRTPLGQAAPLYLLAGVNEIFDPPKLIVFNGQAVFEAKSGVHTVGCGDTSLIRYLADHLYYPALSRMQGIAVGAYLIRKAAQYVDYCGEPIDVICGSAVGFEEISPEIIQTAIHLMEDQEQFLSTLLIQKPF